MVPVGVRDSWRMSRGTGSERELAAGRVGLARERAACARLVSLTRTRTLSHTALRCAALAPRLASAPPHLSAIAMLAPHP